MMLRLLEDWAKVRTEVWTETEARGVGKGCRPCTSVGAGLDWSCWRMPHCRQTQGFSPPWGTWWMSRWELRLRLLPHSVCWCCSIELSAKLSLQLERL